MIKGGPRVVTDGLVLCLDAHDAKSYAGEPVTNLASGSWYTWVNSGAWTQNTYTTHESCPVGFPPGLKGVSGVQVLEGICTTAGSIHFGTGHVNPASASTQYTYSVWFYQKNRAGIGGPYARANVSNTNLGTMKYNGTTGSSNWPVNKWIKLEITFTTQSSDTQTYISNYIGSQVGDTMYFCAPQSEQKSYYSPYANSSRSATNGWVDRSGNSNSGTLTNMIGTGASHYRDGQVIMPVANSYLEFDGTNDYVNVAHDTSFNNTHFSFSAWVYVDGNTTTDRKVVHLSRASEGAGRGVWQIRTTTTTNQIVYQTNNAGTWQTQYFTFFSGAGWYHMCLTHVQGSTAKIYKNGVELSGTGACTQNFSFGTDPLFIGCRNGATAASPTYAEFWDGKMAQILLYNKELTAAEVLSNYNATKGRFS